MLVLDIITDAALPSTENWEASFRDSQLSVLLLLHQACLISISKFEIVGGPEKVTQNLCCIANC